MLRVVCVSCVCCVLCVVRGVRVCVQCACVCVRVCTVCAQGMEYEKVQGLDKGAVRHKKPKAI